MISRFYFINEHLLGYQNTNKIPSAHFLKKIIVTLHCQAEVNGNGNNGMQYKCFLQFSISRMLLNISCRACRQRRQTSSLYLSIYTSTLQYQKTTTCNSIYSIYTVLCIYMYGMGNIITKFILTPNEQLCNNNNMCNILIHPTKIAKNH